MACIITTKRYKTDYKDKLHYKLITRQTPIKMATTLIDTRKSIMEQIHASWNEFRTLDYAHELLGFQYPETCKRFLEPMAKDFKKDNAPWSVKQSVLERNAVHANKLIRLYIALNIDTKERMHIWQFFEVNSGAVGRIKEEISILKRVQKVLKKQQKFGMELSNATHLYRYQNEVCLHRIEDELKVKESKAKAEKKKNAALRRAKKEQKRKDADAAKNNKKACKRTADWIQANKHGKNVAKREILKRLKTMERHGYTIRDVIEELERQLY